MKSILLAGASGIALIAATQARAANASPAYNWTGCYIGGNVGYGWARSTFNDVPPSGFLVSGGINPSLSLPIDAGGGLGGGQVGCSFQFAGQWVVGIENALSAANITGHALSPDGSTISDQTKMLATITGRVGYAWDRLLGYVKGGASFADDNYEGCCYLGTWNASALRSGWTVGAGLEWAFLGNWSARFEYDFYGFGTTNVAFQSPVSYFPSSVEAVKQQIQTVMFGINYRFGP